ncbi:MAG: 6-phosphogluconolactonase [Planctomycetota bacterium]|nr:6-phosphogluconolactonase [Planctomycetota bacterium]
MKLITFQSIEAVEEAALGLLEEHFTLADDAPHAVMLTGGRTPTGVYERLRQTPVEADGNVWVMLSDERHVPLDSPENNFAKMLPAIEAMGIDDSRVISVHTEQSLEDAAEQYDRQLASFVEAGGRITLGILGMGADGHLASMFCPQHIAMGQGRYAIAVPKEDGPDRISVTRDLLQRVERLVFLVTGEDKKDVVETAAAGRMETVAEQALEGHANVELWFGQ